LAAGGLGNLTATERRELTPAALTREEEGLDRIEGLSNPFLLILLLLPLVLVLVLVVVVVVARRGGGDLDWK